MRGKRCILLHRACATRITPADAGKTLRTTIICSGVKDHPRGCGENVDAHTLTITTPGSPPRMRGKLKYIFKFPQNPRITPADAGKTDGVRKRGEFAEDHPRGCGENRLVSNAAGFDLGSPPRMRGKLICVMPCSTVDRITPADAGKTKGIYTKLCI